MKFLIIKLSSLGDIVHTLPVLNELRLSFPDAQIDWLTGEKGTELLSLIKEINNIYSLSFNALLKLQKENYDYVIDVQGLLKTGIISKLSFGKNTIGFKNTREFADIFYGKKIFVGDLFNTRKHVVDLNLELVSSVPGIKKHEIKFLIPRIKNASFNLDLKEQNVLIFPSTTWKSKLWYDEYWLEIIEKLQYDYRIVLLGAKNDLINVSALIEKLSFKNIKYLNLIGKTNISDIIFLLQNSKLAIGLDSAGIHLASAVKNDFGSLKIIGIYGPTSHLRNGPYNALNGVAHINLDCMPCKKKVCPLSHHNCMKELKPSFLIETFLQ